MLTVALLCVTITLLCLCLWSIHKPQRTAWQHEIDKQLQLMQQHLSQANQQSDQWQHFLSQQTQHQQELRERFDAHQVNSLKHQQESLVLAMSDVRKQITTTLSLHTDQVNKQLENLTTSTHKKLTEISQEVDKNLAHGFEKTTATFTDIVKRLAIIDQVFTTRKTGRICANLEAG